MSAGRSRLRPPVLGAYEKALRESVRSAEETYISLRRSPGKPFRRMARIKQPSRSRTSRENKSHLFKPEAKKTPTAQDVSKGIQSGAGPHAKPNAQLQKRK